MELDRLRLATMETERTKLAESGGGDPDILVIRPSQSRGGVTQKIVKVVLTCVRHNCRPFIKWLLLPCSD